MTDAAWTQTTIGELAQIFDGPHATPKKIDAGPLFLSISSLNDGRLDLAKSAHLSEEQFVRWTRRVTPEAGDVVFSYETRLGEAAMIPRNLRCCLGRRMGLLRADRNRVDPRFLLYTYIGPEFQEELRKRTVHGATVDRILLTELGGFPIRIPSLSEQRAIAHILGTLDDKIELNRRMNETLEGMARALFKSWFVDFDPVRAKMDGRWRRGQSLAGLPAHLYELFPDRLLPSGLGEIPKGWEVGVLGDVADHHRRSVRPSQMDPGTPYIALEHMPKNSIALPDWGESDSIVSNKYEFKQGEILFGKLRPYFHKVGIAPLDGVCSTDIVVISPASDDWFGFVLSHVSSPEFVEYTNAGSTGTKMPRTNWRYMARYEVVLPNHELAKAFSECVRSSIGRIVSGMHEGRTLAAVRDTLLPKLISGELRVADAEDFVESST